MCSEVGSVDFDGFDQYSEIYSSEYGASGSSLHETIFSQSIDFGSLGRNVSKCDTSSGLEQTIQKVARNNGFARAGVGGEAGVTFEWGGDNGGVSGYVSGNASDDRGNKAEVTVEVNNDGSGSATVSVSHDDDSNSQK